MNTIRFSIKVKALDCYIYAGKLFLILQDGRLVYCSYDNIIEYLKNKYPDLKSLITLAFQQCSYLHSDAAKAILGVKEVMDALHKVWNYAASTIDFSIDFSDIESEFMDLGVVPSMPVLDIKMYNKHVYLGCKEGLYEFLYDEIGSQNGPKIKKGFDEKIVHVDAKFDTVVLSAGNRGLFTGCVPSVGTTKVVEKEVMDKSFRSAWSTFNIMNYDKGNEFTCLVNEVKTLDMKERKRTKYDGQESYEIVTIGKERIGMEQLMEPMMKRKRINMDDVIYCFNSHQSGYFLTKDGLLYQLNLLSKNDDIYYYSTNILREYPKVHDLKGGRPISASILPNGCVIEYFDNVVLYQNSKSSVIETTPSITVRSFVNSYRYKNIVVATKENECTFHSVDTLDLISTSPIYRHYNTKTGSNTFPDVAEKSYDGVVIDKGDFPF